MQFERFEPEQFKEFTREKGFKFIRLRSKIVKFLGQYYFKELTKQEDINKAINEMLII